MGERLALVEDTKGYKLVTRFVTGSPSPTDILIADDIKIDMDGPSYPALVLKGVVFAYLGHDKPPKFPNFDCFRAPDTHGFAFKGLWRCKWLLALEVGIDPAHA